MLKKRKKIAKKGGVKKPPIIKVEEKKEYKTDLDRVVDLVEKRKSVKISEITKGFNITKEKAEEWGQILEEYNLLKLEYPLFGEPELRKKDFIPVNQKKEFKINKKILINVIVSCLLILAVVAFFIIKGQITEEATEKIISPEVTDTTKKAFSGKGSYECNFTKNGVTVNYLIKDDQLRMEGKVDNKETVSIIKKDLMYTYDTEKDKWIKVEIPEEVAVPGSGRYPKTEMMCIEKTIDVSKFQIPEGKIE